MVKYRDGYAELDSNGDKDLYSDIHRYRYNDRDAGDIYPHCHAYLHGYTHIYFHSYAKQHRYGYADIYGYTNLYGNPHHNRHKNRDSHAYSDSDSDGYFDSDADAEAVACNAGYNARGYGGRAKSGRFGHLCNHPGK